MTILVLPACAGLPFRDPTARNTLLQTLNLDSDSNLWVAGNGHVTKVYTATIAATSGTIGATLGGTSITAGIALASGTGGVYVIDLVASLGTACTDASDGCCTTGNFDAGIAITRDTALLGAAGNLAPLSRNTIYVANICSTGLVSPRAKSGARIRILVRWVPWSKPVWMGGDLQ